ncbi:MAG: hypothetical protein LJE62_07550 [Silicimonas sp.]|jgi:hypothetical protein|nr:hypothetical protein [Silicimonas sp.]
MRLTRRELSKLALGSALAAQAAPAGAFFHNSESPEAIAERVAAELTAALRPGCDGSISVPVIAIQDSPSFAIDAAIQLEWPPGLHRRPFTGVGADSEEAIAKLVTQAQAYFGKVWTMEDGQGCFA